MAGRGLVGTSHLPPASLTASGPVGDLVRQADIGKDQLDTHLGRVQATLGRDPDSFPAQPLGIDPLTPLLGLLEEQLQVSPSRRRWTLASKVIVVGRRRSTWTTARPTRISVLPRGAQLVKQPRIL
jgi:hypothetical protein